MNQQLQQGLGTVRDTGSLPHLGAAELTCAFSQDSGESVPEAD